MRKILIIGALTAGIVVLVTPAARNIVTQRANVFYNAYRQRETELRKALLADVERLNQARSRRKNEPVD